MASGWSFGKLCCAGEQRSVALTPVVRIRHTFFPDEHIAVLKSPGQFESLHRKDGLFAEGVDSIFGVKQGEAELQAFCFRSGRFTPAQARTWLRERGFGPLLFMGKGSL